MFDVVNGIVLAALLVGTAAFSQVQGWGRAKPWVLWTIPLCQLALVAYWLLVLRWTDAPRLAFALSDVIVVALCVADWFIFRALKKAADANVAEARARIIEERLDSLQQQAQSLRELSQQTQEMRLSMRDDLLDLRERIVSGGQIDFEGMGLAQRYGSPVGTWSNIRELNALFSYKLPLMEKEQVRTSVSVFVPQGVPLSDNELCAVFSNILDNALAACRDVEEDQRFLTLSAVQKDCNFVVKAENSCVEQRKAHSRRDSGIARLAKDLKLQEHGWGLSILEGIASRHEGVLTVNQTGATFTTLVVLPLSQAS